MNHSILKRLRRDLIEVFNIINGINKVKGREILMLVTGVIIIKLKIIVKVS